MTTILAEGLGRALTLVIFLVLAMWYVRPWLKARGRADALIPLLWLHAFRYVALHLVSAQRAGFPISDGGRDLIVYGDVVAAISAVLVIASLRYRMRLSIPLVWVFVAGTVLDLVRVFRMAAHEHLIGAADGGAWLVAVFYVPLVPLSLGLVVWQLLSRRGEPLASGTRRR